MGIATTGSATPIARPTCARCRREYRVVHGKGEAGHCLCPGGCQRGSGEQVSHRHRVQEEAYVVVAGSGRARLDDEVVELSAWDVLRVAPAVIRSFEPARRVST